MDIEIFIKSAEELCISVRVKIAAINNNPSLNREIMETSNNISMGTSVFKSGRVIPFDKGSSSPISRSCRKLEFYWKFIEGDE